ncbi:molybdenum cofactor biosynthesis protein MoaE [Hufsiella ginkgonis]|uniref:Molybdopterin synthase catalytic subunit n=1 Tax=Hufsiella ginkgonis TaxID=2695274 RepID=A0A7K1XYJ5_9SPHI|nr:molybdenum cofactor biosynthesis protein MoaE [Hufsiella ginkgonis]MXV16065.1 molybdenum cofactor biosynthesis protein MoaE [Hufsiella ginkgonis]
MAEHKIRSIFKQGPVAPAFIAESIGKHSTKTGIGAHSIFMGQVRGDTIDGKEVIAIEYTAYEELAIAKFHEIRQEIFDKYPLTCLHVHHSLGRVSAGELCLFVFASSAHRAAATSACGEVVERIKADLPIWGKELFAGESYQWKENKPL